MEHNTQHPANTCDQRFSKKQFLSVGLPVVASVVIMSLLSMWAIPHMIAMNALQSEYEKVGGKENYDYIQSYQIKMMSEQIKQIKSGDEGATTEAAPETSFSLTQDEIKKIIAGQTINGSADANIVLVEYSDPECPFCQRQYNDGTIANALKTEGVGTIASIFKPITGANHTNTRSKGIAMICAGKIGGYASQSKLEAALFADMKVSVADAIKQAGLDAKKMDACIVDKVAADQYAANDAESASIAQKVGQKWFGTPTTLIINTKTGKSEVVAGAYPLAMYVEKIQAVSK